MTTVPDVAVRLRATPSLLIALPVAAALAAYAVTISDAPPWLRVVLIALVAAVSGVTAARLLRPRVRSVVWRGDGTADLILNDTALEPGREVRGEVRSGRVIGPLIVLTLRWARHGRASLWLLPDNVDADTRRRLRMRLGARTGRGASGNADRR